MVPSEKPSTDRRSSPRRSKICFVLHKFDRGGSLRVAAYLARGFTDAGMDVELVLFTEKGEVDAIITDLIGPDIAVRYLGRWLGPRPFDLLRGLPALVRYLRAAAPDTIIAGANNTALVSAIARRFAGLTNSRLFVKTTNPIASSRHTGVIKWVRRWTYRKVFADAAGVWTLSPAETDEMRTAFPAFAGLFRDVFNPYVTPEMFGGGSGPAPDAPPVVLAVGRLTGQKRLERLIEAFALVRDQAVRLKIFGEGEQRTELTALIRRLGLEERILMPGYAATVADEYKRASLFVLTSDYEGLPAVVLEAMAANCPVLSTDCFPAARAIVQGAEGCDIIEQPDAAAALAAMIDAHLAYPRPTRLRETAERYSIESGIASHLAAMRSNELEIAVRRTTSEAPGQ